MKKIILVLGFIILLSSFAYATEFTAVGFTGTQASGFDADLAGMKFIANDSVSIVSVTHMNYGSPRATQCMIYTVSDKVKVANGSYSGETCALSNPYTISPGVSYYITSDRNGDTWQGGAHVGASYPTITEIGNYTASVYTNSWSEGTSLAYEVWYFNYTRDAVDNPPALSNINCTSCNPPIGDNTPPYTTSDTTPTFIFETDVNANCRIANENLNHSSMGEFRNCTTGEGTKNHICTLTVPDELMYSNSIAYISCANNLNNNQVWNASVSLQMEITDLTSNGTNALDSGIQNSVIWPGATVYSNQQVYLRNLNNQQLLATVDRVAVYGNQRWLLSYVGENESIAGLLNITPVVYSLEIGNLSLTEIRQQVSAFINNTKS